MKILAVIPARGGSRGVARKNVRTVGGKPLIAWTIEAASRASLLDRVIVSTDDPEIAETARSLGADVPFTRPADLAGDSVHASQTVLHALDVLQADEAYVPDGVALLLPTSPLRTTDDIDACLAILERHPDDAVVTVALQSRYLTQLRTIEDGFARPVVGSPTYNTQRQAADKLYAANGAVFASGVATFRAQVGFHHDRTRAHVMPVERSIDIDTPFDLELADFLLSRRARDETGEET